MKVNKVIKYPYWDDFIKHRITTFWEQRRIVFSEISSNRLVGRRGNILWNMVAFDMSRVLSVLEISRINDEINCQLDINTTFQIITEWNQEYWRLEMDTFESYLQHYDLREQEWQEFLRENRKASTLWLFSYGLAGHTMKKKKRLKP